MCRVVVCRPQEQSRKLATLLESAGYSVSISPTVRISPLELNLTDLQELLVPENYYCAIFVSVNAVQHGLCWFDRMSAVWPAFLPVLAVGESTARALAGQGIVVKHKPSHPFNSESLLQLPLLQWLPSRRIAIFRGRGGREFLAEQLIRRGARVSYFECYERRLPEIRAVDFSAKLLKFRPTYILLSSIEVAHNFFSLLTMTARQELRKPNLIVFTERQAIYCRQQCDWAVETVAEISDSSILKTINLIHKR